MQHQSLLNHLRVQALVLKMKSTLYHFTEGSLRLSRSGTQALSPVAVDGSGENQF